MAALLVIVIGGWTLGISPIFTRSPRRTRRPRRSRPANPHTRRSRRLSRRSSPESLRSKKTLDALRLSIPETAGGLGVPERDQLAQRRRRASTVQTVTIADATSLHRSGGGSSCDRDGGNVTATPTPTPATATVPATPTVTSSGLVLIPVVVTVKGQLRAGRQSFLSALQTGTRLLRRRQTSVINADRLVGRRSLRRSRATSSPCRDRAIHRRAQQADDRRTTARRHRRRLRLRRRPTPTTTSGAKSDVGTVERRQYAGPKGGVDANADCDARRRGTSKTPPLGGAHYLPGVAPP